MSIIQMIFMNRSSFYILSCNCSYRIWKIFYLWNFIRFWTICRIKSNHMLTTTKKTSHFLAISFQLCNSFLSYSKKWKLGGNWKKIKILFWKIPCEKLFAHSFLLKHSKDFIHCALAKDDIFISNMVSRLY